MYFEDLRVYPSCVAYFYYGKLEERALSRAWTRPCQSITPLSEHGVPSGNLIQLLKVAQSKQLIYL